MVPTIKVHHSKHLDKFCIYTEESFKTDANASRAVVLNLFGSVDP